MRIPVLAVVFAVCLIASPKRPTAQTTSPARDESGSVKKGESSAPKKDEQPEIGSSTAKGEDQSKADQQRAEDARRAEEQEAAFQKTIADSARVQAWSAALVAGFTLALVFYSHRGWAVAKRSADAASAAVALARQQFIAAQRPLIVVRSITTDDWPLFGTQGEERIKAWVEAREVTKRDGRLSGSLWAVNKGGTTAILTGYSATFRRYADLKMLIVETPPVSPDWKPIKLTPGESVQLEFPTGEPYVLQSDQVEAIYRRDVYLYVIGWVEYADESGHHRRTAFCRKWDRPAMRFHRTDNEDYEYAD